MTGIHNTYQPGLEIHLEPDMRELAPYSGFSLSVQVS